MSDGNGITVTTREIYDSVNNLNNNVTELGARFERLESKITEQSTTVLEARERSFKALNMATDASKTAAESAKDAKHALERIDDMEKKRYKDKIEETQRQKETRNKFYISMISALLPFIIIAVLGFIYIGKQGGF